MPFSIALNGDWDFCPLADPNPPAALPADLACEPVPFRVPSSWRWVLDQRFEFQPYGMFGYPRHWNDVPAAFLRRKFAAYPQPNERVILTFHGVLQRWLCYVNGERITPQPVVESFLPVTFDITGEVRPGENEIIVWCGAWEKIDTPSGKKLLNPNGSWFADLARGIWQDVVIETHPGTRIADVFVQTSTRQSRMAVNLAVKNQSAGQFQGEVLGEIFYKGQRVQSFHPQPVLLQADGEQTISLAIDWPDPVCWSPENPHRYELRVALTNGNKEVDCHSTQFGFREVWFDGSDFYLNGIRTNLRGDAWHYQGFAYQTPEYARNWYAMVKAAGMNFVRLHAQPYPSFFLDIADEMGMLIVDESAIYGSSKYTQSDHPQFLAACKDHLERLVRRDRNHPSVVMWSMQNEMRWVDGRDGYRDAMPALTAAMRALDPTRPILYDGDKRLVPPEWCDALSLHYNIDGTVDDWVENGRQKPLLFGEHGAFHYVSPQVSADLGGQAAYLRFEDAMQSIGENERLFIEYARRMGVTGVTPFNLVHYAHWTLPPDHRASLPKDCPGAGRPNPAYEPVARACAPVTIVADELNSVFFCGSIERSFSIFNDTERFVSARLDWLLKGEQGVIDRGQDGFTHEPGKIHNFSLKLTLPVGHSTLSFQLYHEGRMACTREFAYRAYPSPEALAIPKDVRVAIVGGKDDHDRIRILVPSATRIETLQSESLHGVDILVLGEGLRFRAEEIAPTLDAFVRGGGSLLVLEQDQLAFGELTLSGRKFYAAHPNPVDHPVFDGLGPGGFHFWSADNPHSDHWQGLVNNAFIKPVDGDVEILLECAEGSFGWGGLLWSPLLAYQLGKGRAVFCQVAIGKYFDTAPQASLLLGNLLHWLAMPAEPRTGTVIRVDRLDGDAVTRARAGELVLLPPLEPSDLLALQTLLGDATQIIESDTYQLALVDEAEGANPFHGISAHDLFHMERVTYTPHTYHNRIIAKYALEIPGAQPLLQDVHNPWRDFFINGMDGEWIKMAIATMNHDSAGGFPSRTYAARLPVGKGALIFCQILPEMENVKVRRIYNRLLSNLGADVDGDLFTHIFPARERGIPAFMGLARKPHQDEAAMRAYFASPDYTLNNLGEGVFGWMLRLEQREGRITIPHSAGQVWFLSVFIDSEINRDPSRRNSGELPDSSLVPDLWITTNCPVTVYLNGKLLAEFERTASGEKNLGDALLRQGINRLVFIFQGGTEDIGFRAWLTTKLGEQVRDIRTRLTLD